MTKRTGRDLVWHQALQHAKNEESFYLDEIVQLEEVDVSKRTARDTLRTLADLGWLAKDTRHAHQWRPGPQVLNEEMGSTEHTTSDSHDAISLDSIDNATHFTEGEVYVGTVDRFSNSGDGLIEIPSGHINVGPIDVSAKGETIQFKFVGGTYGLCLSEQYTDTEYSVPGVHSEYTESSNSSE
ncbi:hypothetical protein [Haloarcula marismortui]|uniref:hypothetical protein n=1 Tax=Haloarcula marismortui TaxID=2238 RepID=UPI001268B5BC|nr:hypothetical protein [Haloarcula californiae]